MTTDVKHLYRTLLTLDGNHPTVRTAVLDVHYLHDLVMWFCQLESAPG